MSVYVSSMRIRGSMPKGTNPLPAFRRDLRFGIFQTAEGFPPEVAEDLGNAPRILPYGVQDRYGRERELVELKTVVMENKYLRATFVPQFGGKLWSLFDKENDRELLMANPVLQPGNLAIRNAWTSGGIEWNFGAIGHTYFTCDNVWTAILEGSDGEKFVRIYEFERAKENVWQADFHLPEDSRQLFSHIRVENPSNTDSTTYWWTNIAIPEDGNTRVLSSSENVVVICGGAPLTYEKLPYLSVMPGDLSYPKNATRSFDYFFQPDEGVRTTWEGGVNAEGYAFYDCSTAPLVYHKMFCWGNHRAGKRWQDFLSDPGKGDYIEIQAGFARSQLHDKPFPAHCVLEWTQCYGGTKVDPALVHGNELHTANLAFGKQVESLISEKELLTMHERFLCDALSPVTEKSIVHAASGWGALEAFREEKFSDRRLPKQLCFPASSIAKEQKPWLKLLKDGILPCPDVNEIPASWMVGDEWRFLLEKSLSEPNGKTWYSMLHYGNMLFECWDNVHTAQIASQWSEKDRYEAAAEDAWKESVALTPNPWALRNLAFLERLRGNEEACFAYYDRVFSFKVAGADFSFAAEYLGWLNRAGRYEKAWQLFESLPEEIREADRVVLCAAKTAVKLGKLAFLESVFNREYAAIREGETSLSDLWFEYQAKKMAAARGITEPDEETLQRLIDEAWDTCPPPREIDFRMSYDRKKGYRVSDS